MTNINEMLLHRNSTVARRVTMVRPERGCTEAYKGHCVLCKDVLSFVFPTFDFQVLCFGFCDLCPVLLVELVAQPRC